MIRHFFVFFGADCKNNLDGQRSVGNFGGLRPALNIPSHLVILVLGGGVKEKATKETQVRNKEASNIRSRPQATRFSLFLCFVGGETLQTGCVLVRLSC